MHSDGSADYTIQFRPYFRLVGSWSLVMLYWIDLATDYEIVLHLFLQEVEVRPVELPYTHLE
jgi:hypothetical protein